MRNSAVTKLSLVSVIAVTIGLLPLGAQARPVSDAPMSVDLSPDGRTLAFDSHGAIFTVPVTGGPATRLTNGALFDTRPLWSPNGDRIAFVRSDGRRQNVWVVDRQSHRVAAVTTDSSPRRIVSLAWGANGGAIALAFGSSAPGFEVVEIPSGQRSRFTVEEMGKTGNHAVHALAFATDSRSVIIQGGDPRPDGQQLYRFSFALRDQRAITDEKHGAMSPVLSPDGNHLTFLSRSDSAAFAIEIRDIAEARQRRAAVIPSPASPVADSLVELPHYAIARDGSAAFVADGVTLWRVSLSTGRRQRVPIDSRHP